MLPLLPVSMSCSPSAKICARAPLIFLTVDSVSVCLFDDISHHCLGMMTSTHGHRTQYGNGQLEVSYSKPHLPHYCLYGYYNSVVNGNNSNTLAKTKSDTNSVVLMTARRNRSTLTTTAMTTQNRTSPKPLIP